MATIQIGPATFSVTGVHRAFWCILYPGGTTTILFTVCVFLAYMQGNTTEGQAASAKRHQVFSHNHFLTPIGVWDFLQNCKNCDDCMYNIYIYTHTIYIHRYMYIFIYIHIYIYIIIVYTCIAPPQKDRTVKSYRHVVPDWSLFALCFEFLSLWTNCGSVWK